MTRSRGVSEVVGLVVLLAMTILVVGVVVAIGTQSIGQVQTAVEYQQSELVASSFHESVVYASEGRSDSATVDLGGVQATTYGDRAWLRVTRDDAVLVNESMGTVVFGDPDDRHVTYQAGGIFGVEDGHAVLKRAPGIAYRNDTLSVTLLGIDGGTSTSGRITLDQADAEPVFPAPDGNESLSNPVDDEPVTVTIHSKFYRAWGEYIATETDATPFYDQDNHTVSATFGPGREADAVTAGVMAGAPSSTLVLSGGFSGDSYNSSVAPYSGSAGAGKIVAAGDVSFTGGADIDGDLRAGGDVEVTGGAKLTGSLDVGGDLTLQGGGDVDTSLDGGGRVEGDVDVAYGTTFAGTLHYGGTLSDPGDNVASSATESVSVDVELPDSVESFTENTIDAAKNTNDNADATSIAGDQLACDTDADGDGDEECYLENGTYYVDSVDLTNDELVFAPDGGNVTLAVDGDLRLAGSANVRVVGDGRVNVHVAGDYRMVGGTSVTNAADDATRFWLFLPPSSTADLDGGGRFVGVIYGPGDGTDPGAHIEPSIPIFGGLVGDIEFVGGGTPVHYDHALENVQAVPAADDPGVGGIPLNKHTAPLDYFYLRSVTLNATAG